VTSTLERVEDEAIRIVSEAQARGIVVRIVGGLAIRARCPSANHASLERNYPDIDLVVVRNHARRLEVLTAELGYVPDKLFNTLNGDRRRLYRDLARGRQLDVFVGDFDMAHHIPMDRRLTVDALTVPLAELFLSKAQIVALNRKDVLDLLALLLDHAVADGDGETINLGIVARLCACDWGLYTTVSMTLGRLVDALSQDDVSLSAEQTETVRRRVGDLQAGLDRAPKTLNWNLRARVGKRVPWYQEVEEVQR
jgi:hypothetical protein